MMIHALSCIECWLTSRDEIAWVRGVENVISKSWETPSTDSIKIIRWRYVGGMVGVILEGQQ